MISNQDEWVDTRTPLEQALDFYSDVHKDAYGFRPRQAWHGTLEDLEAEIADLCVLVEAQNAEEAERESEAWTEFQNRIKAWIENWDLSQADAVRWDFESFGLTIDEVETFCYHNHLAYTREAEITEMLNAR